MKHFLSRCGRLLLPALVSLSLAVVSACFMLPSIIPDPEPDPGPAPVVESQTEAQPEPSEESEPPAPRAEPRPFRIDEVIPSAASGCEKVAAEEYWQIQLERQQAMLDYQQTRAEMTSQDGGYALEDLETEHKERMQTILTDHGLQSTADLMPDSECRQETLQGRQQYLRDNPEIREQFMEMSTRIRKLKGQGSGD